jgi:anthranilate synthase component 2
MHSVVGRISGWSETMDRMLIIDNYDSFVYNLVQDVGETVGTNGEVIIRRNDEISIPEIETLDPDGIVISPGPGTPQQAGVSMPIFDLPYPTLGVCLGHQALCAARGAPVSHALSVVHGKPSVISHDGKGVFDGLPNPMTVGRYHSLTIEREDLPKELIETARTDDERGVLMAVRDRERQHIGVQFHPESILTGSLEEQSMGSESCSLGIGKQLIENFKRGCE